MCLPHTSFNIVFSCCILIGLMRIPSCVPATITLFEDIEHRGINSTFKIGESACVNLVGKLNDFYSSVDTMGGCFVLCEHQHCRGKCETVTEKLGDLSTLGLNDVVSSIMGCPQNNAQNGNQTSSTTTTTTSHPRLQKRSLPSSSSSSSSQNYEQKNGNQISTTTSHPRLQERRRVLLPTSSHTLRKPREKLFSFSRRKALNRKSLLPTQYRIHNKRMLRNS